MFWRAHCKTSASSQDGVIGIRFTLPPEKTRIKCIKQWFSKHCISVNKDYYLFKRKQTNKVSPITTSTEFPGHGEQRGNPGRL